MDSMNMTSNSTSTVEQNACILTDEQIKNSYNLELHIVSIFVLLIISFVGAGFSVASGRIKFLRINPIFLNTGKFFGSGVVLATGFVHILPEAMATLSDPCLPDSWNAYSAYAGLFAMIAILAMQLIEFLANQRHRSMKPKHVHVAENRDIKQCTQKEPTKDKTVESIEEHHIHNESKPAERTKQFDTETPMHSTTCECKHMDETNNENELPEKKEQSDNVAIEISQIESQITLPDHCHSVIFQDDGQQNKISTYLLEFGIAVHSVLIGLTLGTTTESFIPLFIALSFHQFFEAIALGAQIANLKTTSIRSAIYMVAFFSLTTPVGIAIGIGIHSGTYNPKSVTSLLVTGILDSFAAGILIYVALVNLITAEMGANVHSFYTLRCPLKVLYFGALYLGVAAMAVIGRWA